MDPIDLPESTQTTLSADESLRLLARGSLGSLGRIVYTRHALPVVLPVSFALDFSGTLIVSTPGGSSLAADLDGAVVALQVDSADQDADRKDSEPDPLGAVSVMVHGTARATKDGTGLRLVPELISGLRLEWAAEQAQQAEPTGSADK
ncbi:MULTISPECIES: pyridoxamine 5'-phosphate oxidase family protein [Streptacidiphilus]|uniref:Pyridoxamine 5'-phosphate oxidase family protein n=2 Tax=Streptacidiphilus TaxID=228398 RepID=A0ABV6UUF1_9ACTN|nr:pyridoxamine 5'-phosphate oxidase family protein [Streptacidiphilus jeojiense]